MIDNLIIKASEWLSSKILPSTMVKLMLIALILALLSYPLLGAWPIILVLVGNNAAWLVTEFLYAKQAEDEDNS